MINVVSILAFIGSSAIGLNFLISPVATQLCESYNPQIVTILGGIISIAGLLATSFVTTDYGMFLSYSIVWGIGSSLCYASTYVVAGTLFHKHLAFAMGFVAAGSGVGGLAMSPSIERMLEAFGWKTTMLSLGMIASFLIAAAMIYRQPLLVQQRTSTKKSWRELFDCSLWCIPAFSMLTVSLFVFNFGYYIPIIHVVRYHNYVMTYLRTMTFSPVYLFTIIPIINMPPNHQFILVYSLCVCIYVPNTGFYNDIRSHNSS